MNTIRVAVYRVGKEMEILDVPDNLGSYQKIVDGMIEVATLTDDGLLLICNEEGIIYGMPPNRSYRFYNGEPGVAFGDFFVCRSRGSEFAGLSDEDIQRLPSLVDGLAESAMKIHAMAR